MNTDETVIHTPEETEQRENSHNMKPGASFAVARGCSCPALDNNHGFGIDDGSGEISFWHDANCPLHGVGVEEATK
jgi:hypothetical protein